MTRTFIEDVECPQGHRFPVRRMLASAGFIVETMCKECQRRFHWSVPNARAPERKLNERDIEARLVQRVKQLGGEVRKVQWVGRNSAPDRIVMLPEQARDVAEIEAFADALGLTLQPWQRAILRGKSLPPRTIWVEIKAPGLAAKFPRNAHERAQQREHERMRKMGQRVEVVDSYEQIEELLK